jgi:hypothetical protein
VAYLQLLAAKKVTLSGEGEVSQHLCDVVLRVACVCVCACLYVCVRLYVRVYARSSVYACSVSRFVCVCLLISVSKCVCMCVCVCVCACVRLCNHDRDGMKTS